VAIREKIEPEAVDLGLSIKWANFNIGAFDPTHYGDYFAWGETEPKEEYTWENYKWCDGTDANITKYNSADGKTILEPADDAAQVHWGGKWRMPSDEEFTELREKCTWTWTTQDGVKGYKITGPSGNSIFIPAAGFHYENGFNYGENGDYWSAQAGLPNNGKHLNFYPNKQINSTSYRYFGFPIRPVYDDRPTLTVIPTPEDAKVSFLCIGYQAQGHSITVDKGKNVLYQVSNVDAGYLSQGDSIYNLTKDTTLYVTLRPFSDGNWVKVDKSELTKQEGYYVSRNNGGFASHSVWNYYVLPVLPGETYRVRGIAGQHAALWMAASTAPNPATNTRPTKISCCANRGVAAYVADEVTIPDGAKYLIINSRNGQEMMVERKVPDPCLAIKVNDTLSINLMCVEGGTFMMGAMEGDEIAKDDEKPAHKVTLTYDYHIMQTEVTQSLWEAVMGEDIYVAQTKMANASKPAYVGGNYPMYYVRMNDALEFIDKLNAMTGIHFRLPTEAEWEYAARGGNKFKGYLYAGSNNADDVGWYTGRGGLHRVAQLKPNELGIYDMSGNVGEMCLDYGTYGETYKAGDVVNPCGNIRANGNRFWRGGSYTHSKDSMRVSQRSSYTPSWGGTWLGLRLVLAEDNDFRTIRVGNSYFDMSFVKGGTFVMGSDTPNAEADEKPLHEVTLSDYYIGQTEVTQHLWKKVMSDDNNPSAVKGNNLPITNITWNEAQVFVQKLSELTGMRFRLPTEAEWEYAARGGQKSKGYTYAGSNDIDEVGWYNGNSSNKTHAVGQKQPNELGIYDMTGNVWEYCSDWHMPYSAQAQTNPIGATTGEKHVLRGGCYHYDSKNCTNTNRHSYYTPDNGGASTSLRIVLEVEK
jgi:formylglycine-generating enzyme required for sulfatase activity